MNAAYPKICLWLSCVAIAASAASAASTATSIAAPPARKETVLQWLLRVTNLDVATGQQRGDEGSPGNLYVVDAAGGAPVAWTDGGRFRSPIFDPSRPRLYALRDDDLLAIDSPLTPPTVLCSAPGLSKLIAVDSERVDAIIALTLDAAKPLVLLGSKDCASHLLAFDSSREEEARFLGKLRAETRVSGTTVASVKTQSRRSLSRTIEWTDVVVARDGAPDVNVSRCDGVDCSQPALSVDGRSLVYVKSNAP